MDHLFFLSNAGWKQARETVPYDHVIVGSGFCALAFAQRTREKYPTAKILIVERGAFFLPEHFQNLPLPFKNTIGGLSETFPWTLSAKTVAGTADQQRYIHWQHGMVPFFGGRSTLWSAWCPRPNRDEMDGWPGATISAAHEYFGSAEKLLRVRKVDQVDKDLSAAETQVVARTRPVYGALQKAVQTLLEEKRTTIPGVYRTEAAPLACDAESLDGIDFQKFSTPGDLLALAGVRLGEAGSAGGCIDIATHCEVEKIIQQDGTATALQTSRGILPLGSANLILAMGTLPPATLVRNSFPDAPNVGERFTAHFITAIVARVPKALLDPNGEFGDLELGACYVAGVADGDYKQQFHIQLSALSDKNPKQNAGTALRYMPDVVATATQTQLETSPDHVVFVCAVLGELDYRNRDNWFRTNPQDGNLVTNSLLQIQESAADQKTWDAMDNATFDVLERVLGKGAGQTEYWFGTPEPSNPDAGYWASARPSVAQRRVSGLVHEGSSLYIGEEQDAPVDTDYKLRGSSNVYVTGGGLWPQGGSWNPTMTMVALAQDLADKLGRKGQGHA
ncbi:GMC family oxidoreductase [Duganella ginsengisoli]|uniref:GMC family oxidoreductase n=2 Tax=Pseudoduganella ginsengisoli TaxID=1462440 RepID=A0A6L6PYX8_9BURK|nr:GMC family oxidoreductase [Pseudoduganella ginsengisoli]